MAHGRLRKGLRLELGCVLSVGLLATAAAALEVEERQLRFERLTVEQGLASSSVRDLLQDRNGFLWLATHDGLHRYDGYGFVVYRQDRDRADGLADAWVESLTLDRSGAIWIATRYGGLHRLDPGTGRFARISSELGAPPEVTAVFEDSQARLWVGTAAAGLHLFDTERGRLVPFSDAGDEAAAWEGGEIRHVVELAGDQIVVVTSRSLHRVDESRRALVPLRPCHVDGEGPLHQDSIGAVLGDRAGTLWLGGETSGLFRCTADGRLLEEYRHRPGDPESFSSRRVTALFEDRDGDLWIGTGAGELLQREHETGLLVRYANERSWDPLEHAIRAFYEDGTGLLWIGTEDGGLIKLNRGQEGWRRQGRSLVEAGVGGLHVMALYQDSAGRLWIGTRIHGLFRVDGDWRHDVRVKQYRRDPADPSSLPLDHVSALHEDSDGALWVGVYRGGLSRLAPEHRESGRFEHHVADASDPDSLSDNRVRVIELDRGDNLWVGTRRGLCRLRRDEGGRRAFSCFYRESTGGGLPDNSLRAIYADREGSLWLGTDGGLARLDSAAGGSVSFTPFLHRPADPTSLSDDRVRVLYEDRGGGLWVGTRGGLNHLDRQSGRFRRYVGEEWLPSDVIYGIREDGRGRLWLSTLAGLVRFEPDRERSSTFDNFDGLLNRGYELGAHLKSNNGLMLFGGAEGLDVFAPDEVEVNLAPPPVVITSWGLHGGGPDREPHRPLEHLRLPHSERSWELEFAALDFTHPERNRYAYRLEGFDSEWTLSGSRRFASYTNLPPGEYRLRIKGSNSHGVWNEAGISLPITIVPPFWMRWWWRFSVAAAIVLMAVAAHRLRTVAITRRNRELEERNLALDREIEARRHAEAALRRSQEQLVMAQKMEAVGVLAGGVAHDFNNLLTAITGYSALLLDQVAPGHPMRGDLEEIRAAGERGAALTLQLLAFSRRQPLEPRPFDLNNTVRNMQRMLRPVIGEDIELVTRLDPELKGVEADEAQIEQVIMNLVVNARDSMPDGGRLELRTHNVVADDGELAPSEPMVCLTVEDDGEGIAREVLGQIFQPFFSTKGSGRRSGLGLAVVYGIVSQHHGWIEVDSEPGAGATFNVFLPALASSLKALPSTPEPVVALPRGSCERVLLVEDEPAVRDLVERTLRANGYQVSAAATVAAANELIRVEPAFDLILSDVVLPDGNGVTFVERLLSESSDMAVLLMSGYADPKSQWPAIRERGYPFIRKPFSRGGLLRSVRGALDRPVEMAESG